MGVNKAIVNRLAEVSPELGETEHAFEAGVGEVERFAGVGGERVGRGSSAGRADRGHGIEPARAMVTNADLVKLMDTSDEWIIQRTGIRERPHPRPRSR